MQPEPEPADSGTQDGGTDHQVPAAPLIRKLFERTQSCERQASWIAFDGVKWNSFNEMILRSEATSQFKTSYCVSFYFCTCGFYRCLF